VLAFCSKCSFNTLAATLGLLSGQPVSKQALAKRFTGSCVEFVRHALFCALGSVANVARARQSGAFECFGRVLIQDSTALQLHPRLASAFPGSRNQSNRKHAIAKIQATYDLLAERFVHFALTAFTRNDQAASQDILDLARPGDLILRDLGYFVLSVFTQLHQRGAFFLSRRRYQVALLNENGQPFELLWQLRRHGRLDTALFMGQKQRMPVRLIAVPLPQEQADARRRKAKQNRDRRAKPSKEYLALLGWEIFVTNVSAEIWSAETACQIYGLRWRIEIIFKAWKSHFRLADLPAGSDAQVQTMLYARLLFICIFQTFFGLMADYFLDAYGRSLSLLRLTCFMAEHHWLIAPLTKTTNGATLIEALILKHCCYDKRTHRSSYPEDLRCLS